MKEIEFDVDLSVSDLYVFSMRHTYFSISGVFGLVISIGSLVLCALRYSVMDRTALIALLIIGSLFTVVQPLMLYSKAMTQRKQNKDINAPLHYSLGEEGIGVSQGEQTAFVHWYDVRKIVQTSKAIYLYMSPVRAFIFPKEQCGEQFGEMADRIKMMLEKYKDYEVPESEGEGSDHETPGAEGESSDESSGD